MAYTPHTWVCGETISDAQLNNLEEGIQQALPLILTFTEEETTTATCQEAVKYTYNLSWQEIYDALGQGRLVLVKRHIYEEDAGSYEDLNVLMPVESARHLVSPSEEKYCVYFKNAELCFADTTSKEYIDCAEE